MSAEAAAAAQRMAETVATAWEGFESSVRSGVQGALQAYREGNEDLYREQQEGLARMLWNQTDTMLALGQITEDQAMEMKSAVADEFGVMVDEVDLATGRILELYGDWAAGGGTTADDIVEFLTDIGQETDRLVETEVTATQEMITSWQERQTALADAATEMQAVVMDIGDTARIEAATASLEIGKIEDALEEITRQEWTIRINVDADRIPDEFRFNSPQFKFYYALQDLVKYAGSHPIPVGADLDMAGMAGQARVQRALQGEMGGATYDQRQVRFEGPIHLRDEMDIEILARRVAELMGRRAA